MRETCAGCGFPARACCCRSVEQPVSLNELPAWWHETEKRLNKMGAEVHEKTLRKDVRAMKAANDMITGEA